MGLSADHLSWRQVEGIVAKARTGGPDADSGEGPDLALQGAIRFQSQRFTYGELTWSPFVADVSFAGNSVEVAVSDAALCGISTPGRLRISPDGLELEVEPATENQELDPALGCLWDRQGIMTGSFDLHGQLAACGEQETLVRSLRGTMEFAAHDGRIYRFGLLAKIFAVLNITEVFKGQLPDLAHEGFAYRCITATAELSCGKLALEKTFIDGSAMGILCDGEVDLVGDKMNLTVLVAPFKTVDSIVDKIPIASGVLEGRLVSIPVKVTGDLRDPQVTPLSPSAVGSRLLGFMKRIVQVPVKIIQPLLPGKEPATRD
jgi:hypothetical protein